MYILDIIFDSYKTYNNVKSYRKTAFIIIVKYNFNISKQIIIIWIKNINNMKLFIIKEHLN